MALLPFLAWRVSVADSRFFGWLPLTAICTFLPETGVGWLRVAAGHVLLQPP